MSIILNRSLRRVFLLICLFSSSISVLAWSKTVPPNDHGESGRASGTYFHLYAEYQVAGIEKLVFDLQVSCGNHTFKSGRVVHGYLPALYAKETASGAAVMIATPRVCDAIRFAEGRPVADTDEFRHSWQQVMDGKFIPFTVWFDNADNQTSGYGYATASAFTNPASPLDFVSAKVEPSSAKEFERWYAADTDNLLRGMQIGPQFATSDEDKAYWSTFDPAKKLLPLSCTGVAVSPHGDGPSANAMQTYYPQEKPRYWLAPSELPDTSTDKGPSKLDLVPVLGTEYYDSSPSKEFPIGYNYLRHTKQDLEGHSLLSDDLPAYYPATRSDGYPFAAEGAFQDGRLTWSVDLRPEKKGLLSCALPYNPIGYGTANFREMYEYYFGPGYGEKLATFGETVDLEIVDPIGKASFEAIPAPLALPHFLIGDEAAAEFVTFEFYGGGHVQ
ncbi:hypothetical protein GFK91_29695 (plasmid) [Roseibium aggregatum]|uniref:hypothetical protein n=1 Tax=Roseibium aggregatum TaxID=187304 RepID=UPI001E654C0C|nr:hypothetical protein [Roseibium aggregatum]UES59924.1 hypothetical protein GFK91_29695 [Roseibium aggregatum]